MIWNENSFYKIFDKVSKQTTGQAWGLFHDPFSCMIWENISSKVAEHTAVQISGKVYDQVSDNLNEIS